jgi:hypothetical protein
LGWGLAQLTPPFGYSFVETSRTGPFAKLARST